MKKSLAGGVVAVAFALSTFAGIAGSASAAGGGYGSQPGYPIANGNTPCAGHGAFGAFGQDDNFAGGADGDHTAYNNSTLCGNPQGAAGVYP